MHKYYNYPSLLQSTSSPAHQLPAGGYAVKLSIFPLVCIWTGKTIIVQSIWDTIPFLSVLSELQAFRGQELYLDLRVFSQTPNFGAILLIPTRKEGWGPTARKSRKFSSKEAFVIKFQDDSLKQEMSKAIQVRLKKHKSQHNLDMYIF